MKPLKLSVVIPAHNEEGHISKVIADLVNAIERRSIPYEIIVVNDNSTDMTAEVVEVFCDTNSSVRLVNRHPPNGFGRAIRTGLSSVSGDVVIICMGDQSDDPQDVIAYYEKALEGYDCVFGSRFIPGAEVHDYPRIKLICNRIVNKMIQLLFWTGHNDLTNAFKAYRTQVIRECEPYKACHFNITIEMSLSALVRDYSIATIPIRWYGRSWGSSKLALKQMGRRYLVTLLKVLFEKILIHDDLMAERRCHRFHSERSRAEVIERLDNLEERLFRLEQTLGDKASPL